VHDFGHPPFGHIGESELDNLARQYGLKDGFEGNAQTFRILVSLTEHLPRSADNAIWGLDLTGAVLAAAVKYPWPRADKGDKWRKYGYYEPDSSKFDQFVRPLLTQDGTPTLEAEIMDWADDITYAVHDVQDFFFDGAIPLDRLAHIVEDARRQRRYSPLVLEEVDEFWTYATTRLAVRGRMPTAEVRGLFAERASNFPRRPFAGSREEVAKLGRLASEIITDCSKATSVKPTGVLYVTPQMRSLINVIKQLTWFYVIDRPRLVSTQRGQRQQLRELFNALYTWTEKAYSEVVKAPWDDKEEVPLTADAQWIRQCVLPKRLWEFVITSASKWCDVVVSSWHDR
jgi:dGTPase